MLSLIAIREGICYTIADSRTDILYDVPLRAFRTALAVLLASVDGVLKSKRMVAVVSNTLPIAKRVIFKLKFNLLDV